MDQQVNVRFASFDQRNTPELEGRVTQISPDAFVDQTTGRSFYRSEIVLNDGERDKLPEGAHLIPGMPIQAYIKTDDRTPMAYFMRPFIEYFAKAFREA